MMNLNLARQMPDRQEKDLVSAGEDFSMVQHLYLVAALAAVILTVYYLLKPWFNPGN